MTLPKPWRREAKQGFVFYLCVSLAFPQPGFADVADEFKVFVDQLIPLTYQLAEQGAHHQESKVFLDRLSLAQSTLSRASDAVSNLGTLTTQFEVLPNGFCPRAVDGSPDLQRTIQQLNVTSQSVGYAQSLQKALVDYQALRAAFVQACQDPKTFEAYQLSLLSGQIGYTPNVDVMENVYLEMGVGGGAGFAYPPLFIVFAAISIIQIITNVKQMERIQGDKARLERERAKDEHYRSYAKAGCEKLRAEFVPYFVELDSVAGASDGLVALLQVEKLEERRTGLNGCLKKFEGEYAVYLQELARKKVEKARAAEGDAAESIAWAIRLSPALLLKLRRLDALDCDKGWSVAEAARDDLAALRLLAHDVETQEKFLPEQKKRMAVWDTRCGVMP